MPERQAAPGTDRIGQGCAAGSAWGCVRMWIKGARPLTLVISVVSVLSAAVPSYLFARGYGLFVLRGHASRKGAVYTSVSRTNDSAAILRFAAVAVLCLTVAVSMQIAANYFNDYADGVKGVDAGRSDEDAKRPESGAGRIKAASGSGFNAPQRLVASGVPPRKVLKAGVVCTVIAIAAGIAAAGITGLWGLPAVGLLCVAAAWFYSGGKKPYGYRGLSEAAAFAVFGPVAVFGTEWALLGVYVGDYIRYSGAGSLAAPVGSGALAVILMLLNNMRDAESDRVHGKLTFSAAAAGVEPGYPYCCNGHLPVYTVAHCYIRHWYELRNASSCCGGGCSHRRAAAGICGFCHYFCLYIQISFSFLCVHRPGVQLRCRHGC